MKNLTVTSPLLPPLEEFTELLEDVWSSKWLTNNGYFHQRLEAELCRYLGISRDDLYQASADQGVNGRRYFYPLISNISTYRALPSAAPSNLIVAQHVSDRVICLPIHASLEMDDVDRVVETIKKRITQ